MKLYGLNLLQDNSLGELKEKRLHLDDVSKWSWIPHDSKKIQNSKEILQYELEAINKSSVSNYKIGENRQNVVLVFFHGVLTYSMLNALESFSLKYFFIKIEDFCLSGSLNYSIKNDKPHTELEIGELQLNLADVASVIWTFPDTLGDLYDFSAASSDDDKDMDKFFFRKRWAMLLKELKHIVREDCIWYPGDIKSGWQGWQQKVSEYFLFNRMGLNVPEFIFTNNYAELSNFFKANTKVLFREFSSPPYNFPITPVSIDSIDKEKLKLSPSIFQEYISKRYEYRVVILNDKIWACKIDSQNSELAKADWRAYDNASVKWEIEVLPKSLTDKLFKVMNALNLNWCCVDIILSDKNNKYYILEINRPGSHYWLDSFVGLDIGKEIVRSLIGKVDQV